MSASHGKQPPLPGGGADADGDEGAAALVAAMESADAAIYCLAGPRARPVWANARARALGTDRADLPVVDGRSLADVVDGVIGTGRRETLCGPLGSAEGPAVTVVVRAMPVGGAPGAMLVLEHDDDGADPAVWSAPPVDLVEQAQLSLLPPSLPMLPDLALAGSYHQASSVRAAGGDWYDAVPLGSGKVALVVGDAVGHGVAAAGAMSRLRGAMRSSALRDPSPAHVLTGLDAVATQMDDIEGASVFYGVLDAASGVLTYTAAAHPAPLVVAADGSTEFLPMTPRPPLGTLPGAGAPVAEHVLAQGATLVLFSNGALAGAPDYAAGLDRLVQVATGVLSGPDVGDPEKSAGLATAIAEGVRRPQGFVDDVAVLVVHRRATTQEPLQLDLLAVPAALPGIRRRLGAWLTSAGLGEQDRVGVMVAVGEACANAAEHAYRGTEPGPMQVRAEVDVDGVLTVTVRDEGTWRPPDRDPGDRGRGLLIMRQLVDGVTLQEERGTTVTLSLRLRRAPESDPEQGGASDTTAVVVDREGERPVVRAAGAVDQVGAEQLRIRLLEASHGGTGRIELDLSGVTLFSSAAVRVVLAIARIAQDEGWRLPVHAPAGGVTRHVLEVSGLAGLVDLR